MKRFTKYIFATMLLVLAVIWAEIAKSPNFSDEVKLTFFNVGQGDSAMISKGDYQLLIDGGPDDTLLPELGKVMPVTDRKIEAVILTHPHADHLIGLNQILERYRVDQIYLGGVLHSSDQYLEFLSKIKEKNIKAVVPDLNQQIQPFENAALAFLWPGKKYEKSSSCDTLDRKDTVETTGECLKNLNNASLVFRFCYFDQCSFYLGDLENDAQKEMINISKQDYRSQIVKISHHGSSNGSNQQLLNLIQPKFAVISVGAENKYGHPHAAAMTLLENIELPDGSKPKILRTDRDGTIGFVLSPASTTYVNK